MTCPNHPETQAVAFCRSCGKPLCDECKHSAQGTIFCAEHVPAAAPPPPPPTGASPYRRHDLPSPALAAFLGFIPGVGAIYNGQYAKGLIHAIIFGLIISIMHRAGGESEPMLAFLLTAWFFYMI